MSEFVDGNLGRYLDQQPGMREALLKDPVQKMQVETLRKTLGMVERALIDEGVPEETRRRVLNRAVWGEPEGRVDVHARMRDSEKLRRERELLLTTFDPSASDVTINQLFTELAEGSPVRDDLSPEGRPAAGEETSG